METHIAAAMERSQISSTCITRFLQEKEAIIFFRLDKHHVPEAPAPPAPLLSVLVGSPVLDDCVSAIEQESFPEDWMFAASTTSFPLSLVPVRKEPRDSWSLGMNKGLAIGFNV